MSIISDALKKAQMMRENNGPESAGGQPQPEATGPRILSEKTVSSSNIFNRLLIPSIILILVSFAVLYVLKRPSDPSALKTPPSSARAKPSAKPAPAAAKQTPNQSITPSRHAAFKEDEIRMPVLNGIMYTPSHPVAIIDGLTVSEGENVHGATVLKIFPDGVIMKIDGVEHELRLR